jgi:hypothetical protein
MSALADSVFVEVMTRYTHNPECTPLERELAQIGLDLYQLTKEHPAVVAYVDARALHAMNGMDQ